MLAIVALAAIFFCAGWFGYEWAFQQVSAEIAQPIAVASVQEALDHRVLMSLSCALAGALCGVGTWLGARLSAWRRYAQLLVLMLLAAVIAGGGWLFVLARRTETLAEHLGAAPGVAEAALPLSAIPLYEIGLFASGCVLVIAVMLVLFPIVRGREQTDRKDPS